MERRHHQRSKKLPISIENVRKKVLRAVEKVENEVKEFLRAYTGNQETHKNLVDGVEKVCAQVGKSSSELFDFTDLDAVLVKARVNNDMPLSEYNELRRMLDRAELFSYIAYQLRNDLVDVYLNQVEKFCISFYQETKRHDLQSVKEYELTIADIRQQIDDSLYQVERNLDDVEELRKTSVMHYVENYAVVLDKMEGLCRGLGDVCYEIRKWVAADAEYPRNIQEEINSYNRRLLDLKDVVKEVEEGGNDGGRKLQKAAANRNRVERQVRNIKDAIGSYRRRKRNVEDNQSNLETERRKKVEELHQVQEKLQDPETNSPSTVARLSELSDSLETEIRGLDSRIRQMDVQMEALRIEEEQARGEMEKATEELEGSRRRHEAAIGRSRSHDEEMKAINEDVELHEARIAALKKIRELKLHSDTLKKIHNHGYNPEHVLEIKDEMQEAFRVTSEDIGRDWTNLYQRLPFDPPRDSRERQRDLEIIDISHRRLDVGFTLLAQKSLEKWRRLSHMASVDELVATLRKMRMHSTARKIRLLVQSTPRSIGETPR